MAIEVSRLLGLPLELRNAIYEFTSARSTGSHLILKEYLEKLDQSIERLPPRVPTSTTTTTTTTTTASDGRAGSAEDVEGADHVDMEDTEGEDVEATVDEDEEGAEDEDEDDRIEEHVEMDANLAEESNDAEIHLLTGLENNHPTSLQVVDDVPHAHDEADHHMDDLAGEVDGEGDENDSDGDGEHDDENAEEGSEDSESDEDDSEDEEDGDVTGPTIAPPPPRPSYGRNTKYRHVLPLMQLSHCPPPTELLQANRQINSEATQLFRDACVLTIDVNQGFQHFSFFNETMTTLLDAPYSPLEHMRKLRLIISWDSEWLREKSTPPDAAILADQQWFFAYFFSERIQVILNVVRACPELRKVTIEYHDTEDTTISRAFMADRLGDLQTELAGKFYIDANDFPVATEVEFKEFFSAPGTAHARDSILALRRADMERFLQSNFSMR